MARIVIALLGLLAAFASCQDGTASTSAEKDVPQWAAKNGMQMNLSIPGGQSSPLQYTVIPLTENLGLNESQRTRGIVRIDGLGVAADVTNYNQITDPKDVAYLSCDEPSDDSFITPNKMLNELMAVRPKAIVLYSMVNNWCSLDDGGSPLPYTSILSMADAAEAAQALGYLNATHNGRVINVSITGNTTDDNPEGSTGGRKNNSAVAMSILYSITGLITLLFLIIIATGAVRAHRYPERYGPRSAFGGRPRQSRAKGLARAVLETLPIVKFSNPQPQKPDPELELEPATTANGDVAAREAGVDLNPEGNGQPQVAAGADGSGKDVAIPDAHSQATRELSTSDDMAGRLGCSICTEDFKVGEDMRVLPCRHQFHPNCIDPWLINVSGTCPLCRLDLRPDQDGIGGSSMPEERSTLPPPLALETDDAEAASTTHRSRFTRIFDVNRLRQASAEEQMEALRHMRATRTETDAHEADGEERHQGARLAAKLKDKFRIRTRARSPEGRDC